ncbi:PEP-CTERM sorting domain-containing protein [Chitinimonas arctica]|uniref:PEP-CTERM sorting domain-containing protein n=2 Tax=Chitinimonas arctica TaxID=2594795 RepID=A0A516SM56_9NEIS|nr:PEP-CTERM sorting domain-containing protein [Chitinimonas arctica]
MAAAFSASAQADLNYSFDTDAQGWTATDGVLSHVASGGNSGGFLSIHDGNDASMLAIAPGSALGSWSSYLGGTLSFDGLNLSAESADWDGFGEVTIFGSAGSVTLKVAPPASPSQDGQWHRYSALLSPTLWGSNLAAVLNNVTGVTIQTEFHNGVSETAGLDNFKVAAVPEPETYALLLAGLGLVGLAARRRRG